MGNQQAKVIYLAGLIDGEGCLDYQRNFNRQYKKFYYSPRMRLTMTGQNDLKEINKLITDTGLPFWVETRVRRFNNPKWRDAWTITVTGYKRIRPWIKAISEYSIVKKSQWENMDKYIKSREITNPKNKYSQTKDYTDYELGLIQEIKELKKDN